MKTTASLLTLVGLFASRLAVGVPVTGDDIGGTNDHTAGAASDTAGQAGGANTAGSSSQAGGEDDDLDDGSSGDAGTDAVAGAAGGSSALAGALGSSLAGAPSGTCQESDLQCKCAQASASHCSEPQFAAECLDSCEACQKTIPGFDYGNCVISIDTTGLCTGDITGGECN